MASIDVLPRDADYASSPLPDLRGYRRIAILTEGNTDIPSAKTAIGLLRFRPDDVIALIDSSRAGQTANALLRNGGDTPIVASLAEVVEPDALFIGISPNGGKLPEPMRIAIREAVAMGLDVISGLHDFLANDAELLAAAERSGARLIDVRRNTFRSTGRQKTFPKENIRIHTVGHDCSVGKMVTALEVQRGLTHRGEDAEFLATGQTGIMIAGNGVPIDCVVSDFVNGAAEDLVFRNRHHDFLVIEGQGSLVHPAYSGVTTGLLHGCAPHGLILCYEAGRKTTKTMDHVPILPLVQLRSLYESMASVRFPCEVIGIAINGRHLGENELIAERERVSNELGLPACDVYRDGPDVLVEAALELRRRVLA